MTEFDAHLDALERAVAGAENRLLQLDGMEAATPKARADAESALDAARAQLAAHTGTKPKAKPKAKAKK